MPTNLMKRPFKIFVSKKNLDTGQYSLILVPGHGNILIRMIFHNKLRIFSHAQALIFNILLNIKD